MGCSEKRWTLWYEMSRLWFLCVLRSHWVQSDIRFSVHRWCHDHKKWWINLGIEKPHQDRIWCEGHGTSTDVSRNKHWIGQWITYDFNGPKPIHWVCCQKIQSQRCKTDLYPKGGGVEKQERWWSGRACSAISQINRVPKLHCCSNTTCISPIRLIIWV